MRCKSLVVLCGLVVFSSVGGTGRAQAQVVYQGETVIALQVLDPLSGQVVSQERFQHPIQVVVADPVAAGGLREGNPFNLSINPLGMPTEEGQFSIFSAIPFHDPRDEVNFLIEYWRLQHDGARLSGELVNSHTADALAVNLLNAVDLSLLLVNIRIATPLAMVEGTTLQGTLDGTQADLVLRGNTVDSFHPFEARIVARRVQ